MGRMKVLSVAYDSASTATEILYNTPFDCRRSAEEFRKLHMRRDIAYGRIRGNHCSTDKASRK
jgi:hypothetical protein